VDEYLLTVAPPCVPADEYICLEKALVYENDKDRHIFRHAVLSWTKVHSLPKWVKLSDDLAKVRL